MRFARSSRALLALSATLALVVAQPALAGIEEAVKAMGLAQLDRVLTNEQITAIVAFLNTLTGTYREQAIRPAMPKAPP